MSKSLRLKLFVALKAPFSRWARRKRMRLFLQSMSIANGTRIIDLGGTSEIWAHVPMTLQLTILNLPSGLARKTPTHHSITYVEGDACDVSNLKDRSFDLVFSNSVIEHVGNAEKRAAFAREVRRLGNAYWVQTPAIWFPIEAHNGMLFWWFYPQWLRDYFLNKWRKRLPDWTRMVEETTILTKAELMTLFPDASIRTEKVLGFVKSYIVFFPLAILGATRNSHLSQNENPSNR
jgi:hypothetical protein